MIEAIYVFAIIAAAVLIPLASSEKELTLTAHEQEKLLRFLEKHSHCEEK